MPAAKNPVSPVPSPLRVVTYNVLADRMRVSERLPVLFDLLGGTRADIIALQEVTPWIARLLFDNAWTAGYQVSDVGHGKNPDRGGQLMLSRHPIIRSRSIELPGRQRRTALFTSIDLAGEHMQVATSHLESFLADGPTRAAQLDAIFTELRMPGHAMVLGDFNFGDGEREEGRVPAAFVDLWHELHPHRPGYTWNIEQSEMARVGSFPGEQSRRIDRILLRSDLYRGTAIDIIGNRPVHPDRHDLYPSDHFGLAATLTCRPPQ